MKPVTLRSRSAPASFSRSSFYLRHAVRWLLTSVLLAIFIWCLYVAVRFHHVDNHAYRLFASLTFSGQNVQSGEPGLGLGNYKMDIAGRTIAGVDRNLSGLAYDVDNRQLIAVVNRPATLLLLDLDGNVRSSHRLRNVADVEGVAWLGENRIALVEEGNSRIVVTRLPASGDTDLDLRDATSLQLNLGVGDDAAKAGGNKGYEGLGYDIVRDELYVAKEHSPRGLYRVTGLRRQLDQNQLSLRVENLGGWLDQESLGTDLSSVEVNAANGHLLLLSDESQSVVELDRAGRTVGAAPLSGVPQAEGVALGADGAVYVVSEPNLFYRLRPTAAAAIKTRP